MPSAMLRLSETAFSRLRGLRGPRNRVDRATNSRRKAQAGQQTSCPAVDSWKTPPLFSGRSIHGRRFAEPMDAANAFFAVRVLSFSRKVNHARNESRRTVIFENAPVSLRCTTAPVKRPKFLFADSVLITRYNTFTNCYQTGTFCSGS